MKSILSLFVALISTGVFAQNLDALRILEHVKTGSSKLEVFVYMQDKLDYEDKTNVIKLHGDEAYGAPDTVMVDSVKTVKQDSMKFEQLSFWNEKEQIMLVYLFGNDQLYGMSINYLVPIDKTKQLRKQYKKLNGYAVSNEFFLAQTHGKLTGQSNNHGNLVEIIYPLVNHPKNFKQVKVGYAMDIDLQPGEEGTADISPKSYWTFMDFVNLENTTLNTIDGYKEYEIPFELYGGGK